MKKHVKRLTLNRETLVRLENNLIQVVGGATAVTCAPPHSGCEWSGRHTCGSCQLTCTTNYC